MAQTPQTPAITISADEVNCLIHSYLEDSGMAHTAFSLMKEGQLDAQIAKHKIPRGELVELLGKALLYLEVEAHFKGDEAATTCKTGFSLLQRHVCSSNPPPSQPDPADVLIQANGISTKRQPTPSSSGRDPKRAKLDQENTDDPSDRNNGVNSKRISNPLTVQKKKTTDLDHVLILPGHKTEIFVCAFNPDQPSILASGSKDATIKIWDIPETSENQFFSQISPPEPVTIADLSESDQQADLTSLHWNPEGTLLAVGSYDSIVRICTAAGGIYFQHRHHAGPIFTVRFSKSGKWLVSASLDHTACLWDVKEKRLHRQYKAHTDCCLDVDWLNDDVFASCGADFKIHICHVNEIQPVKTLRGHTNEINMIKCNRSGTRLASCSDDMSTRIWNVENLPTVAVPGLYIGQDQVLVLRGHIHSVSTLGWCPPVPGTNELLVTASFDGTARLWDSVTGQCLKVFSDHRRPVYALAVSPDGSWLATGSGDGWLHVYDLGDKTKRWSWYAGAEKPGIFEISWQSSARGNQRNRFALALESRQVAIMDLDQIFELDPNP